MKTIDDNKKKYIISYLTKVIRRRRGLDSSIAGFLGLWLVLLFLVVDNCMMSRSITLVAISGIAVALMILASVNFGKKDVRWLLFQFYRAEVIMTLFVIPMLGMHDDYYGIDTMWHYILPSTFLLGSFLMAQVSYVAVRNAMAKGQTEENEGDMPPLIALGVLGAGIGVLLGKFISPFPIIVCALLFVIASQVLLAKDYIIYRDIVESGEADRLFAIACELADEEETTA